MRSSAPRDGRRGSDPDGAGDGDARLHAARAGARRQAREEAVRRLQHGRDSLRAADGQGPLRRDESVGCDRPHRETGDGGLTPTALAMGTPGFMPPEQAHDAKRAKKPSDVFSMGATLYALLTGKAPFAGTSPSDAIVRTARRATGV